MSLERYLDHIECINSLIKSKEDLIKKYDCDLENCTSHLSDMPRAESSSNDKMNSLINEKLKIKDELTDKRIELENIKHKIDSAINAIDHPLYQDILIKMYYEKKSFKELCNIYSFEKSQMSKNIELAKKAFNSGVNRSKTEQIGLKRTVKV